MSLLGGQRRHGTDPGTSVFTVDLEEYFEVKVLRDLVLPAEWDSLPTRADRSVDALLGYLSRHGARATFFVSPWISESRPLVAQKIASAGHEVAVLARSPSSDVDREQWPDAWRKALRETRDRLEQVTGRPVVGCRSSRFNHALPAREAVEILAEEGFRYDSTLSHRRVRSVFGEQASAGPLRLPTGEGSVLAVPPTSLHAFGRRVFTVGRTAFRVLPYAVTRRVLARATSSDDGPAVFSMRSWEMDPAQPTLPVSLGSRIRLYWGLRRVPSLLSKLLDEFVFDSAAGALGLEEAEVSGRSGDGSPEGADRPRRRARRMHG